MAASSDQPVSVGNLAAVLEGGALGGFEQIGHIEYDSSPGNQQMKTSKPVTDFDLLFILRSDPVPLSSEAKQTSFFLKVDDALTSGKYLMVNSSQEIKYIDQSTLEFRREQSFDTTVYGIKTGGGSS